MCGIAGVIRFDNLLSAQYFQKMTDIIDYRGPDDEGFYLFNKDQELILGGKSSDYDIYTSYSPQSNIIDSLDFQLQIGLAHRRLSIVDLSPLGHQPMCIDSGNYWISYNGEVYNHIEIKAELEALGHVFISHSDTEVILVAYQEWGKECLHKFNGMFAFLIYDKVKGCFFAARDRFGVKPLYYYQDNAGIYFASEIKQFTVLPSWKAELNHQRSFDFLVHGLMDHTHETLFRNVYQLRGGEYTVIDLNQLKDLQQVGLLHQRWYKLKIARSKLNYTDACHQFKQIFFDSIKLRLRSDVDVGSCLSGGLDSSAIVSVMAEQLNNRQIKTFSACSHHAAFDESKYVNIVADQVGAKAFYCYPEVDDLSNSMQTITWHQDEPFVSSSIYAQWQVFELAKSQQVSVMLDGQGADEQLAGYQGLYFPTLLNQTLRSSQVVKFVKELFYLHKIHGSSIVTCTLKSILSLLPEGITILVGKLFGKQKYSHSWLNINKLRYVAQNPALKNGENKSSISDTSYAQLIYNHLPMLLHWEDRNSMAHSIESRVPFLDYRLVEFNCALPDNYKIEYGVTKKILRDGLASTLPKEIKNRMSKLGFVTPEEIWINDNPNLFRQLLEDSLESSHGVFNQKEVIHIFEEVISGKRKFDFWLWRVINFGQWMKLFKVQL